MLIRPHGRDQIVHALAKLGKLRSLEAENENLRSQISEIAAFENIVGQSPAMRAVIDLIRTVAKTDTTVLLQGETGTGKEVIARAIHNNGSRAKGAFIAISCAGLAWGEAAARGREPGPSTTRRCAASARRRGSG